MDDIADGGPGSAEKTREELLIQTFEEYYDKIYRFFLFNVHSHEQAQDLAGEVFCRVASAWPTYDPEKAAVSTWVFTVAKNLLRDSWRKRRLVQVELGEIAINAELDDGAEKAEQKEMLCQALQTLTSRERELIGLKYVADLSTAEIASLTGLSPNNIRVTLFRTMKKLQTKVVDIQAVP
ncbi:MAG: sigma-70 family RNA polymerase sigma factor [Limnochordia bacterium]|nr:sigma-70 family RNA polymerase sigma factor [Limnochordia bacterium]